MILDRNNKTIFKFDFNLINSSYIQGNSNKISRDYMFD